MNILVEDLRVGMKWNGKRIISVSEPFLDIVMFWLEGEDAGRAFEVGTQMWVENVIEGKVE